MCSPRCFDYWSRLLALADARLDNARLSRRAFLAAPAVPLVAAARAAAPAPTGPTRDLLDATLSFDLHSHPGLFKSTSNDTLAGHRQEAEYGRVKLIALTATSDAAGIDHVGIGTDLDGIGPGAIFTSYARWPSLAAALVDHGYRPDEAAKILGGNAQRVFRRVGASAAPRTGR